MPIGAIVAVPELQSEGPARTLSEKGTTTVIRFLATGAEMTQDTRQIVRFPLLPGTRVTAAVDGAPRAAEILPRRIERDAQSNLLVYSLRWSDGVEARIREDAVTSVASAEPVEALATAAFHDLRPPHGSHRGPAEPYGPLTFSAREELLAWRDAAWAGTGGVIALAGSRVRPLPHQLLAARRVLSDRSVRFLLADEVGLGKTIEAGLIMQSLLAMQPTMRVLVVVPGALVSQWFLELFVKFGGRPFLMLDRERLEKYPGNPWKDEQFVIASNRALEEMDAKSAMRLAQSKWDLLIVDECHRMQPQGVLYKRISVLSRGSPHVLLLSATPARQHPDAYLALLALLQPQVYRTDDQAGFAAKLTAHDRVVDLLGRTMLEPAPETLAKEWLALLGADVLLAERARALGRDGAAARDALVAHVREHHQLDHRIIRNRRQVLARLSSATGVGGLTVAVRACERVAYEPDAPETRVRELIAAYRAVLIERFATDDGAPPRLAHWLLQLELGLGAHPLVLDRLLAMRATVLADPEEFASYRARALPGETMAQVLRSDLSENEITSHVAVSATCHLDESIEEEPLKELRAAVAAWGKRTPARDRQLVLRLTRFWKEQPQEKVLIFTTHSLAVSKIAAMLTTAFGEDVVETFGAHQDTIVREESAKRFRDDKTCWAMVCDPLGGEGRNFQFVSVVVHHDLPWSVAAVEQRIGRVDRIGRDGEVPSWVLTGSDPACVDAAWADVLERAVGVFSGPSSGLEFVTDALETRALAAVLEAGAPALRALEPELVALVAGERDERDRREDELFTVEEAPFAQAARMAAAIESAPAPVESVLRWIRSQGGTVRRDEEPPRAHQLRSRYNDKPEHGVFDRAAALSRPDLGFFALGHGLIDRLLDDAAAATWCRAQAWRRKPTQTLAHWEGVRAAFALTCDLAPVLAAGLRLEHLRRLFIVAPPQRVVVFVRADGSVESDPAALAVLAPPFDGRLGDTAVSQVASRDAWTRPLASGAVDQVVQWQETVRRASTGGLAHAQTVVPQLRARAMADFEASFAISRAIAAAQAATAAATLGAEHADARIAAAEAEDEERQHAALHAALAGAQLDLASLAYVVVG